MPTTVCQEMRSAHDQTAECAIQRAAAVQHFLLDVHEIPMPQVSAVFASAGLCPGAPVYVEGRTERSYGDLIRDFLCRLGLVEDALRTYESLGLAEHIDAVIRCITRRRTKFLALERVHPVAKLYAGEFSNW